MSLKISKKRLVMNINHKLMMACHCGDLNLVKRFISEGADPNYHDYTNSNFPLMEASYRYNNEVIEFLIENGADINLRNKNGNTALHKAVFFMRTKSARLLIDKGANIYTVNNEGRGLDYFLYKPNYHEIGLLLLEKGFNYKYDKLPENLKKHADKIITLNNLQLL